MLAYIPSGDAGRKKTSYDSPAFLKLRSIVSLSLVIVVMPGTEKVPTVSLLAIRLALRGLTIAAVVAWFLCFGPPTHAGFETVIDSPPTLFTSGITIKSDTQINLFPGGVLPKGTRLGYRFPSFLDVSEPPIDNVEINLLGGSLGTEAYPFSMGRITDPQRAPTNVTYNLQEGTVWGDLHASYGALMTLSDARIEGELSVLDGSLAIISGGVITDALSVRDGSIVRISGGIVGSGPRSYKAFTVSNGSIFLMSGGVGQGELNIYGSYARILGGRVEQNLWVSHGQLEISGGSHGAIKTYSSEVTLAGGDFQLDGEPLSGLTASAKEFAFPLSSVLTGVLADGSPIILANHSNHLHDYLPEESISLRTTFVPAAEPRAFIAPGDSIPSGLRSGQSLELGSGALTPVNLTALQGSTINIVGGEIGQGFQAAGATVLLASGVIGSQSAIYHGTTLRMAGGEIGDNFQVGPSARLEMSGGEIAQGLLARSGSEVIYSGGKLNPDWFSIEPGSSFTIVGNDFRVDGIPVAHLTAEGNSESIDLPTQAVLSGTLNDGTPFAFHNRRESFSQGVLKLQASEVPDPGPALIRLPNDPVPNGLREGQTLIMTEGGEVGDLFTAGWDSIVRMSGGRIGSQFQAVGSFVSVTGGEIESMEVSFGSALNLSGGRVKSVVSVGRGAVLNLSGGEIGSRIYAWNGGNLAISGGTVGGGVLVGHESQMRMSGGTVHRDIQVNTGGSFNLHGGEILGGIYALEQSEVDITGGKLADGFYTVEGAEILLRGSDFRIDGEPVELMPFLSVETINLSNDAVLSGVLADGTPFAFTANEGDQFAVDTLRVLDRGSSPFIDFNFPGQPFTPPRGLRPGRELTLKPAESVGDNFTAGWGSSLMLAGGEIGENFEAVGAQIMLDAGTIGNHMDVLFGTELHVTGGSVGADLEVHRGGLVNLSGGEIANLSIRGGAKVNITGGGIKSENYPSVVSMEADSELHIVGTDFLFGNDHVEGLEPGGSVMLDWSELSRNYTPLHATLSDGSTFSVYFEAISSYNYTLWEREGPRTIVLTAVLPADLDANRLVDGDDFLAWQQNGLGNELTDWRANYGAAYGASLQQSSAKVIPEPNVLALVFAGLFLQAKKRRRQPYASCFSE